MMSLLLWLPGPMYIWGSLSGPMFLLGGSPWQRPPWTETRQRPPYGKERALRILLECILVTARKRSLRWLCFYRCLSVHRGGGMRGCSGGACMVAPGGGHAWDMGIRRDIEIRSMSGRYASYWNAFLLQLIITMVDPGGSRDAGPRPLSFRKNCCQNNRLACPL